ncbi:FHA domain-containing protein [Acaryochloris marina]|uniref:FHA domain-containing protein n=1 Tax=Acaryochloris marina TaxID=155978 RepID=UPI001BAFCAFB|nr:FHA domain-containing protein [Acaryochloris marina]QUY43867.1 FHA domain-containing protein [Acaryochloris marina S15]
MNVQAPTPPIVVTQDCHVLMIEEEEGVRCVLLESPTYSLGRDKKNSIVLPASKAVSRFHAMLLRIPGANSSGYSYRIVDGDATGKLSTNGVVVNGERTTSHTLVEGDAVMLGNVKASYRLMTLSPSGLNQVSVEGLDIRSTLPHVFNPHATLTREHAVPSGMNNTMPPIEEDLPPTMFFKKAPKKTAP